ncbi:nuclear receptor subfamily 2 group E member 1 [Orussus abietinus]|uniref:nuclear receptor subfamily 2 group E member 1 n=1 Tax=Orussus abietinus TaxID=222816 RepID=UPI000626B775|nr:nuclear receptor subfamily 2 group E member 1 [Orussus abietinus]
MGTGDRLLDIPCNVCGDRSSGKHYGIYSCDGCSGFFKRSIHSNREYTCKAQGAMKGRCPIDKTHRNQCRACRLTKCFQASMNRDAVQHERGPRKPKPHSVLSDKHHQQQSPVVAQISPQLSPHPGTPIHHEAPRIDLTRTHLLSHHRRLRCDQRPVPYPRTVSLVQKPSEDSPSPAPRNLPPPPPAGNGLYHTATVTLGSQPPLLHNLISAEKCQEFVWGTGLQPEGEGSLDQSEAETSHSPVGLSPTWEVLQETTARLLFMSVRWVRCLGPFQTLSKEDQLLLLQQAWTQLFLLHLAQWSISWDITGLFEGEQVRERLPPDAESRLELATIQKIMCRFRQLSLDGGECGCLKAIVLFTPETTGLRDVQSVELLQDQAQCILGDYIRSRYPQQPMRFGRLLLLLPHLRAVKSTTVELLFFRETIGEIPITNLLDKMYQRYYT